MPDEIKKYDMVVIGGGPAGLTAATTASTYGKSIALVNIDRDLGGAGINTGTVPSKTLRETALALTGLKSRNLYGVDLSLRREMTVSDFLGHENNIKTAFHSTLSRRLETQNADVFTGTASFVDAHTVSIKSNDGGGEVRLYGESIIIATGSSPVRPELFPFGQGEIYDSDTILKLDRLPKTMAAIGAGVIGSEYGCTFAALGAKVHIIDGRDVLLPFLDAEVSKALGIAMQKNGILFHWNEKVTQCTVPAGGGVTLTLSSGASLTVDAVLVAAGRQSNTATLGLPAAGVTTGKRGIIPVDENYRTNVPHIYAAGDVIGFPALASTSMEQARRAVRHALGQKASALSPLLPNGIYTIPEISMVGETEESLKKLGVDYVVGVARYEDNARGRIIGDTDGFLKLLFRRDDRKLVGVHVIGEQATELVHIGLMVMLSGAAGDIFAEACFNVPTLSMLYKNASLAAYETLQKTPAK